MFVELVEESPDLLVHVADHGGVSRTWSRVRLVALSGVGRLFPLVDVGAQFVVGNLESEVGNDGRIVEKEGFVLVLIDEGESCVSDELRRVLFAVNGCGVAFQWNALVLVDNVFGEEVVGVALAVVAVESIEALFQGIAFGSGLAEPPFSKSAGGITFAFEQFSNGGFVGGQWKLPLVAVPVSDFVVGTNKGVAAVLAGHERVARWRADRGAGVVLGETHAFGRNAIKMRGLDFLLPVAAQLRPAEIVGHDINDVGMFSA